MQTAGGKPCVIWTFQTIFGYERQFPLVGHSLAGMLLSSTRSAEEHDMLHSCPASEQR